MNYDDFVRELTRSPTHAPLSAADLQSMAKRASSMFLCEDTPLNDAVVKVAGECPGISSEQVRRVVELANVCTYQNLFEKTAGDKNVQFEIADPNEVLRRLNSGASAPIMKLASSDYAASPPAARSTDVMADLALCEVFGVRPEPTAAMQKTAMMNPQMGQAALDILDRKANDIKAHQKYIQQQMTPPEVAPPPDLSGIPGWSKQASARDTFDEITKEARDMPHFTDQDRPKKTKEIYNALKREHPDMPAEMKARIASRQGKKGKQHQGPPYKAPLTKQSAVLSDSSRENLSSKQFAIPASKAKKIGVGSEVQSGEEGKYPIPDEAHARNALARVSQHGTPAEREAVRKKVYAKFPNLKEGFEERHGESPTSKSNVKKEEQGGIGKAAAYVRMGGKDADLVQQDLESYLSLDAIKTAARANLSYYPEANPHGDLIRSRQILEKQAEDLRDALDINEHHYKEAQAMLGTAVVHHVLNGGGLGEVTHLLAGLGTPGQVKLAMEGVMPALERRLSPRQFAELQADVVRYEMEKGASARVVNPEHPISRCFAGMLKLAETAMVLRRSNQEVSGLLKEANELVQAAVLQHQAV